MGGNWGMTRELNTIKGGRTWYKKAEVYGASVNFFGNGIWVPSLFRHC
jgi:hypothetical protein